MATTKNSSYSLNNSDIITLNIGGWKYSTQRSTILENIDKQTYFDLLIRNHQTEYFIDRDGKYFSYIINSFRDKKIYLPDNLHELKQFLFEVQFYELERFRNEIENYLNRTNEKLQQYQITILSNINETSQYLVKLIGPLKLLNIFSIEPIGKKFINFISMNYMRSEEICCQFLFTYKEKFISCQPNDPLQRLVLAKQAKKMGLIVSYNEDYFYIPIEQYVWSKEDLTKVLQKNYQAIRMSSHFVHNESYNLVEQWLLSNEFYLNASQTSVQ